MRWWILLLLFCALPAVHAVSGWYYAGDTFKDSGILYGVEGFDYGKVLLDVGGHSYVITLGDCVILPLAKYCYSQSGYPDDTAHIKYQGGMQLFGYYLSITAVTPKLDVTRTISSNTPYIGTPIEANVTITNSGDTTVESLRFIAVTPDGLVYQSGPGAENGNVLFTRPSLSPNGKVIFSYYLLPRDYVTTSLTGNLTYSYAGLNFSTAVTAANIVVTIPLSTANDVSKNVNLDEIGNYTFNVSNTDQQDTIDVHLAVTLPKELRETDMNGLVAGKNNTYTADLTMAPNTNTSVSMHFVGSVSGTFHILTNLSTTIKGTPITRHSDATVTAKADKLSPTIKTSSNRAAYRPGDTLTASGILENVNQVTTFETISGTLSAAGLFSPLDFRHQEFPPQRVLTEAETTFVMPTVNATTTFTLLFHGIYSTPGGEIFEFNTSKDITVSPVKDLVTITRMVEPANPFPGNNVTVTVNAKNVLGQYVSFTTHDSYDLGLIKAGGILYSENSLDRDQEKQLYIYQLFIPKNFTASSINLTTEVLVSGEQPVKYVTTVPVGNPVNVTVQQNTTQTTANQTAVDQKPVQKKGFFTEIWDFIKGLFGG